LSYTKPTFKKAFGIEFIPTDAAIWMLELGSMTYRLSIDGIPIEIGCGRFGGTKHEAWEID